jgi:predicted ATPase
MALNFYKLPVNGVVPNNARETVYLLPSNWDDYTYKTIFTLTIFDEQGNRHQLGSVKIGYIEQPSGWTEERIPAEFNALPETFFSLGQDADYYKKLVDELDDSLKVNLLTALGDVVYNYERLILAENERVFRDSFLRNVNRTSIDHQFRRILRNEVPLTEFDFFYEKSANARYSGIKIEVKVQPNTKPSTNIHVLIGRNGVGKTTLLNNMVNALLPDRGTVEETGRFAEEDVFGNHTLEDDYFAGVVSVSFSAFDPFSPPDDQPDPNVGMRYYYVGLKKRISNTNQTSWGLKSSDDLHNDFVASSKICFALTGKRDRWLNAIRKLESDSNFAEMNLTQLIDVYNNDLTPQKGNYSQTAFALVQRMSSGHAIVLLTITKLVETVEEKTLIFLDEPESHLHPPLLSAFTRALSDLLINRNGIAIIATHSPVVLQEVPKSCVSILRRTRLAGNVDRPERETFGENVGVLTREVFGLEVVNSGFHDLLVRSIETGSSYEQIVDEYSDQLGLEARALLKALVTHRDRNAG